MTSTIVRGATIAAAAGAIIVGGIVAANAASTTPTPNVSGATPSASGAPGTEGTWPPMAIPEKALSGAAADKVRAAALAAVPGGTIIAVETDNGAFYEAHVKKADGTRVEVKMDATFTVTKINTMPAGGPGGLDGRGRRGPGCPGDETELIGTLAARAKAAALAAVPGATVERVSTEHGGGYEAHVTKADGTHVQVVMDISFKVLKINTMPAGGPGGPGPDGRGPGGPGPDGRGPAGAAPASGTARSSSSSATSTSQAGSWSVGATIGA